MHYRSPTGIVGRNKPSLIDNIFISKCTNSLNAGSIIGKISDHLRNLRKIQIKGMKNIELVTFSADLENTEPMHFSNLNEMYNRFHQRLLNAITKMNPKNTVK